MKPTEDELNEATLAAVRVRDGLGPTPSVAQEVVATAGPMLFDKGVQRERERWVTLSGPMMFDKGVEHERDRWVAHTERLIESVAARKARSESAFDRAAADLIDGALRALLRDAQKEGEPA